MLTSGQKNKIVNSYSRVLANILSNLENKHLILDELQEFVRRNDCSNFYINPLMVNKYKDEINSITINNKNDKLQQILLLIFKRRYAYLLDRIIENTNTILSSEINKVYIHVFSQNELSEQFKKEIQTIIYAKVNNAEIDYKVNRNLTKNSIDIVSNNNICSLNLKELSKKFLEKKQSIE